MNKTNNEPGDPRAGRVSVADTSREAAAVVVGLCGHGLGIVRDLGRSGIRVIALESDRSLPGTATRYAEVRFVDSIHGEALVEALEALAGEGPPGVKPVLFLTNDSMVRDVGGARERLGQIYSVSWLDSAAHVLRLLDKRNLEERAREAGLNYPRSMVVSSPQHLLESIAALRFPLIAKPAIPLSPLKAIVLRDPSSVRRADATLAGSFPLIVQEFIEGDDRCIHFGAMLMAAGRPLARFEGRKLMSRPMGHTTIAVSEPSDEVFALASRFFAGLDISGPVSLELKQAADGTWWVIEPTVGRTDFWLGLCSASGVNIAVHEYQHCVGAEVTCATQQPSTVWLNGERHPLAIAWLLGNERAILFRGRLTGLYVALDDPVPLLRQLARQTAEVAMRAARKARHVLARRAPAGR